MAKDSEMIIAGADCENCMYFVDTSDVNHKILCRARDKQYYYGACIYCSDKRIKREE